MDVTTAITTTLKSTEFRRQKSSNISESIAPSRSAFRQTKLQHIAIDDTNSTNHQCVHSRVNPVNKPKYWYECHSAFDG